jgi:TonB family protein
MATQTLIAPYYRLYELPWSPTEDVERRFRVVVRNVLIIFLLIGLIIPFLPMSERSEMQAPQISDRVVKLLIEKKVPPPPPPPVVKEESKPEPEKPKPVEVKPKPDARKLAAKALAVFDELAALRDTAVIDKAQQTKNLTAAVNEQTRSERALITGKVGVGSGGINTASMSRGYGGGTGALTGRETTQVTSNVGGGGDGRSEVRRTSGSSKGARSREEVELIFDKNKGAIASIYNRAVRDNPDLKGKVVFEITISPTGDVLNCVVVSSELHNPELERKFIARIKLFKFEARDVESLTLTKPVDFFPAG